MDNKELPQEMVNQLEAEAERYANNYYDKSSPNWNNAKLVSLQDLTTGAQIAQSHYEPQLQAKDTTIKEQAEKIEKLMGLLEKSHGVVRVFVADFMGYTPNGSVIEELWQSYKEQHGI